MIASHPSAFVTYDEAFDNSPPTACTPRSPNRSPFSGSRTRAVTSCPARTTESSTADPMYPVAPVRKIRMAEPRIVPLDVPDPLAVEERNDPVLADLEHRP